MLKYMLDTNIVIYIIKRKPIEVLEKFNSNALRLCISSITYAELIFGVEKSKKASHNLIKVEDFISRLEVLDYGKKAANHYGEIRKNLEQQGQPIGPNDLHIAAHARSEGLVLVTNNLKEFSKVNGLRIENWVV